MKYMKYFMRYSVYAQHFQTPVEPPEPRRKGPPPAMTHLAVGCVMAVLLDFFLNMVAGHLSAASREKTTRAAQVSLGCEWSSARV